MKKLTTRKLSTSPTYFIDSIGMRLSKCCDFSLVQTSFFGRTI